MKKALFEINQQGELMDPSLLDDIHETYRPDSPFLRGVVPYVVLLICAFIDGAFFYSLLSLISYDRPLLLWTQIAGFIFGFDFIPVFAGIHYRKIKEGLTKDTFTLWLALTVCALICLTNISLRAVTVDLMSPDLSGNSQSCFEETSRETAETEEKTDAVAWMMAITGMVVPIVTSTGSFYISNHCYSPLLIKKQRQEKMIRRKQDKIRRLHTMTRAYEADRDIGKQLMEDDLKQYAAARNMTMGKLLENFEYIALKLMAHQQDPASVSMLAMETDRENFLNGLNQLCGRMETYAAFPSPARGKGIEKEEVL